LSWLVFWRLASAVTLKEEGDMGKTVRSDFSSNNRHRSIDHDSDHPRRRHHRKPNTAPHSSFAQGIFDCVLQPAGSSKTPSAFDGPTAPGGSSSTVDKYFCSQTLADDACSASSQCPPCTAPRRDALALSNLDTLFEGLEVEPPKPPQIKRCNATRGCRPGSPSGVYELCRSSELDALLSELARSS
jgi:hypothetical protein